MLRKTVENPKQQLEIIRKNPNSPLYSVKTFEELRIPDQLLKGLYSMGFQRPSRIQETILPLLMASPHHNTIAQSQSGTGKTAAFLISSLKRVDPSANYPQVLILSPTLELAMQTADVARKMCQFTGITVRHVTKGEMRPNSSLVEHVLVGTPGKIVDWLIRFKAIDTEKIKVFILDEADIMIDLQGHREQSLVGAWHCRSFCDDLLNFLFNPENSTTAQKGLPAAALLSYVRRECSGIRGMHHRRSDHPHSEKRR